MYQSPSQSTPATGYGASHYPNAYSTAGSVPPPTAPAGTSAGSIGGAQSGNTIPYFTYPHGSTTPGINLVGNLGVGGVGVTGIGGAASAGAPKYAEIVPMCVEPEVTPAVAEKAVQKLVGVELKHVGFERAEAAALKQLEIEVQAFIQQLFQRAHEYANLASRAGTIAPDVVKACEEFDLPVEELYKVARRNKRRRHDLRPTLSTTFVPPPSPKSAGDLLPSDDEGTPPVVPPTLRSLPAHLPSLPPKHTYMKTPASPPKKAALPSLEKKLKTASLVQKSLQNLLLATEDSTNNEDAELLGHIVNWETGLHPRKRWRARK